MMNDAQQSVDSEGGFDAYRVKRAAERHTQRQAERDADAMGAQTYRASFYEMARQAWAGASYAQAMHDEMITAGYKGDGMDGYYR